jgi:prefoldin subunit 5
MSFPEFYNEMQARLEELESQLNIANGELSGVRSELSLLQTRFEILKKVPGIYEFIKQAGGDLDE